MTLPEHLRLPTAPIAASENVVAGEHYRITVLADGLARMEYSPTGAFEDRASQTVVRRDTPRVEMSVRRNERQLDVSTARFHLTYDLSTAGEPFTPEGLMIQCLGNISSYHSVWRYGEPVEGNLGGTARTLDNVDGRRPLEPGILSRNGITVFDDSATLVFDADETLTQREPGSIDVYVFAYGRDYDAALQAFHRLTGPAPVLPRYALGNWWSRYHRYSAEEYEALLDRFDEERVPLSVAVLDMDWHLVDEVDPRYGSGWTGYTWNRDLFPDPAAFAGRLHERGLALTLNDHPADGVRAFEDGYDRLARRLGIDPASEAPVAFDPADPDFLPAFLEEVAHPLEEAGVDFWWIDWQSGPFSRVRGLDPLWMLNHAHFLDSARPGAPAGPGGGAGRRGLVLSRYAGVGSHRYPVGFSGDTVISWESLAFQPEFTATAANVGYGWWSHDIGGHMFGARDDELATRWVQFGVFSPVLRLHSSNDAFTGKEPWRFGEVERRIMDRELRRRHRLVPYLHTMNRLAHEEGRALVRPMYQDNPWESGAYEVPNEYTFGTQLVVAPVTTPVDRVSGLAPVDVWLPGGDWVDLDTGLRYTGGRRFVAHRRLDDVPVFARAGAILPLAGHGDVVVGIGNPIELDVLVVAGADGAFDLHEDRDDDAWAMTPMRFDAAHGRLTLGPVAGDLDSVPAVRDIDVVLTAFARSEDIAVTVGGAPREVDLSSEGHGLRVHIGEVRPEEEVVVTLGAGEGAAAAHGADGNGCRLADNDVRARVFEIVDRARMEFTAKTAVIRELDAQPDPARALPAIEALGIPDPVRAAIVDVVLAT